MKNIVPLLAIFVSSVTACSSGSSSDAAGAPPAPASGDAGGGPSGNLTPLTVWVFDQRLDEEPAAPIAGAVVAVDPAGGGERVSGTTDESGRVAISADFTKGGATITAFAKDHAIVSTYGISPENAKKMPHVLDKGERDFVVSLPLSDSGLVAKTVEVSGTIAGKAASSNRVNVGPTRFGTLYDDVSDTYAIRVPKGKAYALLGSEYVVNPENAGFSTSIEKFFRIDRPAADADATFDLDVATAPTIAVVDRRVHLVAPGGATGRFGAGSIGTTNVTDVYGGVTPGVIARAAPATDGLGFDCDVALAQIELGPLPFVTRAVLSNPSKEVSIRDELGVVPDGTTIDGFLEPPVIVAPVKVGDPISLSGLPAEAEGAQYILASGRDTVWIGIAHRDVGLPDAFVVPPLPDGATLPPSMGATVSSFAGVSRAQDGILFMKKVAFTPPFIVKR